MYVEAADEDDPSPPTPHATRRDPVRAHEGAPASGNCWSWEKERASYALNRVFIRRRMWGYSDISQELKQNIGRKRGRRNRFRIILK
jgi:hypothetical protein